MDALDVRIVRAMGPLPYGPRPTGPDALRAPRIAREVGVTPETVRDRLARLEATGVVAGYEAVPNLRHLGLEASAYFIRPVDEDRRERLTHTLATLDGVLETSVFLSGDMCVDLAYRTPGERDRRLAAMKEAAGDAAPTPFLGWWMPTVGRGLTPLDWRILRAVRRDARRSLPEVASELGLGYRTVKRHHDRMVEEGSVFTKPLLNPAKEPGLVPAALLFFFAPDADAATPSRIAQAFDDRLVLVQQPLAAKWGNLDVMVFAETAAAIEEMKRRGARIPGVARVDALVLADVMPHSPWLDDLVEAQATPTAP